MASFAEPVYDVVFSYQGAFGPPTYGHYKSMDAFAKQLNTDFANQKILMLFMPTAGGSKKHLLPTRASRKNILDIFCTMLKAENPNITFDTSEIENEIFDALETKNKTATIYTIDKLKVKYPNSKICLGMGLDNAYQLPYWEKIPEYSTKIEKIYVVPRTPTADDLEKTRMFNVTNANGSIAKMRFDVTIPWTNLTYSKCFLPPSDTTTTFVKNDKDGLIGALTSVNEDRNEPYMFYQPLPPVVVIENTSIPATSSSMMRYFIGQYIQDIDKEANLIKVQKLMFGPAITEEQKEHVLTTITDYENNVFNGTFPTDVPNPDNLPEIKNYNDEYVALGFAGGNRKTRRRRQNKKRLSQRKKRRSQRK